MKTNNNDNNILSFKDEGGFYTTKLTQDGKPIDGNKIYPFGSLVHKTFYSKQECKAFASSIGFRFNIA